MNNQQAITTVPAPRYRGNIPETLETIRVMAVLCPVELAQMHVGFKLTSAVSAHISSLVEYFKPECVDTVNTILLEGYGHTITQAHVDVIRDILEG